MWRGIAYQNQVTVALIPNSHGQIKVITSGTMPSYVAYTYIMTLRGVAYQNEITVNFTLKVKVK